MSDTTKVSAGGRGEVQPLAPQRHADLIRALAESTASAPPSVRRRAIALANVRIARSIEGHERGKA